MMVYIKLILGIAFLIAFSWILVMNSKRTGFLSSLFRIDTIVGVVAGLYLVATAVIALLTSTGH